MRRPKLIRNGWFAARYLLGSSRATLPLLRLAPAPYAREMVGPDKQACIEGFPRSANTLAVLAFWEQNAGVPLAHHVHVPAQVERAIRLGIPCAVLIREPLEALTSLTLFADGQLSPSLAVRAYIHFHRRIRAVRDAVTVCEFEQVVTDPAVVASRLNARFGTRFRAEPMSPEAVRELVARIERMHVAQQAKPAAFTVPSEEKEVQKEAVRTRLAREPSLREARALFRDLRATVAPAPG